ncbi:Rieske 2Fe-2S domain-containing protein [Paraburkholderia silvatlantica]|uniref:Rieske 2Fe-2S domain-containing protein n=1 Tax=Paraburkholderia silvatlantica TaxID=321895 RepID=UPI0037534AC5
MFLFDNWYVAALSSEVSGGAPLARMICGKPVVLFRTPDNRVAALEDRCMHRGMPLSAGKLCAEGRALQCPYHGLEFDASGACINAPGQATIPRAMRVLTYPVHEQADLVWLWPGDPALADPADIPALGHGDDPQWQMFGEAYFEFKAPWGMILDNLMDLSHIAYVHVAAINGDPEAHYNARMGVSTDEDAKCVHVKRALPNCNPPPQYTAGYAFKGRIDRWQEFEGSASGVNAWSGGTDAGTGAFEGSREGGVQLRHFTGLTPATEGSCHYFFHGVRNFALGDEQVAAKLKAGLVATLREDQHILEAQYARLLETGSRPLVSLAADVGGLQMRRLINRLLDAEAARRPAAQAIPVASANIDAMLALGLAKQ